MESLFIDGEYVQSESTEAIEEREIAGANASPV